MNNDDYLSRLARTAVNAEIQCWILTNPGSLEAPEVPQSVLDTYRRVFYLNQIGTLAEGQQPRPTCGNARCLAPLHQNLKNTKE